MSHKLKKEYMPIKLFVLGLNGFYESHCTDEFLIEILVGLISKPSKFNYNYSIAENGDINEIYHTVCWLFESVLEHGCKSGGNGHHMAQKFTSMVKENVRK